MLLAKMKLNTIKILISKALLNSVINHVKFALISNVLGEYNEIEEEIKNPKRAMWCTV